MLLNCQYCGGSPTISNSHVMPKFMARYLKANSATGSLLNDWGRREQHDIWTGPYLCATCDNQVFSQWENHFSKTVWPAPANATSAWGDPANLSFIISLAFRYAVHAVETSPVPGNRTYNEYFRDLTRTALLAPSVLGRQLFVYPYVYKPVHQGCFFLPGINHLLTCTVLGRQLPSEEDLPNAYLILFPRVLLLFCDSDLNAATANDVRPAVGLAPRTAFDPRSNDGMPAFLATVLNGLVGQGQAQQKSLGLWRRALFALDRVIHPQKACYIAAEEDKKLLEWQRINCPR